MTLVVAILVFYIFIYLYIYFFFSILPEVSGHQQLYGYTHSSKYLRLWSTEERHSGLEQCEARRVNDDRMNFHVR